MKNKKTSLKLVINNPEAFITRAKRQISEIKDPSQIKDVQDILKTAHKLYKRKGLFETAFKVTELDTDADRKLFELIGKSGLTTEEAWAKALGTNKTALKTLRHELKKAYDKSEETLEGLKRKAFEKREYLTRKWFLTNGQTSQTSGYPEWYTPPEVYERARHVMGGIDLDPATCRAAIDFGNKATLCFTKEDDGLKQDWGKGLKIFCNPPFKLKGYLCVVKAFLDKLFATDFEQAIFITPEDSSVSYGNILWKRANVVCIPKGRLAYFKDGVVEKKPNKTTLIWGLNVDPIKFLMAFKDIGEVVRVKEFKEGYTALIEKHIMGVESYGVNLDVGRVSVVSEKGEELVSHEMIQFYRKLKSLPPPPSKTSKAPPSPAR